VPLNVSEARGARVDASDGQGNTVQIAADTLQYSVSGQVQAELVDAHAGQPEDFNGVDVRGKVALVKRGVTRFSDKVGDAAAVGAAGVIVYNDGAGRVQGTLAEPEPIPAATLSGDSGQHLLTLLGSRPS